MMSNEYDPVAFNRYRDLFEVIVINHMKNEVEEEEFIGFRLFASNSKRFVEEDEIVDLTTTPEELFKDAFAEDSLSIQDLVEATIKLVAIGHIDESPVYFAEEQGIYAWGQSFLSRPTLSLWITHPAYPPSW